MTEDFMIGLHASIVITALERLKSRTLAWEPVARCTKRHKNARELFFAFVVVAVRLLDAKLFQAVLKRAEGEAQQFGGFGDVVVGLLHRLRDEIALDVFEIDAFGRQLERSFC